MAPSLTSMKVFFTSKNHSPWSFHEDSEPSASLSLQRKASPLQSSVLPPTLFTSSPICFNDGEVPKKEKAAVGDGAEKEPRGEAPGDKSALLSAELLPKLRQGNWGTATGLITCCDTQSPCVPHHGSHVKSCAGLASLTTTCPFF